MKKQQLELTSNGKRHYASPRLHITPLRSRAVMQSPNDMSCTCFSTEDYDECEDWEQ